MTVGDCTGCVSRSQQQEGSLHNIVAASDSSAGVSESQRHVGSLNNIVAARDTSIWVPELQHEEDLDIVIIMVASGWVRGSLYKEKVTEAELEYKTREEVDRADQVHNVNAHHTGVLANANNGGGNEVNENGNG